MEPVTSVLLNTCKKDRTCFALIGIALSVGTTSVFLPRNGDGANAAQPAVSEIPYSATNTVQGISAAVETRMPSLVNEPALENKIEPALENTIDAGQPTQNHNFSQPTDVEVMPVAQSLPEPLKANSKEHQTTYNDTLRREILKLRQKYQTHKDRQQTTVLNEEHLDSQFKQTNQTVQENLENLRRKRASDLKVRSWSSDKQPQSQLNTEELVAVAPMGSEAYEYEIKPRMVTPAIPPLNPAETYLPKSPAIFEGYIWPSQGELTSGYGWRWGRMHAGIDIAAPIGTPIFAAAAGVVTYAGWDEGGYGNLVEIRHPDGSITRYAHNNRILVRVGKLVDQGQQISEMGSTGYSTGPHLHFEIHPHGQGAENPLAYLPT